MSNSPLISNKRKTQGASDGVPHGSGWNACSLPPRKIAEQATEKGPAEPAQRAPEKAGNAAAETVHGKVSKKEGDRANKAAKDIASSTEKNGGENNGRKT